MTSLTEGNLQFQFPLGDVAEHYDEWAFYRNQFQSVAGGSKAVDFVFVDDTEKWLIEVKDYRIHWRIKPSCLSEELAIKVRDSLAGIAAASCNANDPDEKRMAKRALRTGRWIIVLHLEQPRVPSKIRPWIVAPADLTQKLRRVLKAIDAHPKVVNKDNMAPSMRWTVVSLP